MRIAVLGLSITSSWGNGHAVTYRTLVQALRARGHDVLFVERDVPWYASYRDAPNTALLYSSLDELRDQFEEIVRDADLVIVGSYVPQGADVAEWVLDTARGVVAFYDIDTPITLSKLASGDGEYLTPELVPRFDLYFSFTGGPTLRRLEGDWGARRARALYCAADPMLYYPELRDRRWILGYLGTYTPDRQPAVERLLVEPARRLPDDPRQRPRRAISHLIATGCTGPPRPRSNGSGEASSRNSYTPSRSQSAARASMSKFCPCSSPISTRSSMWTGNTQSSRSPG
jgi:spore maturation protein CgeB